MLASEMASHVCDCEALATLRFWHLGQHFMKQGDFEDNFVGREQGTGFLNARAKGLHKRLIMVKVQGSLHCPPFCILYLSGPPTQIACALLLSPAG